MIDVRPPSALMRWESPSVAGSCERTMCEAIAASPTRCRPCCKRRDDRYALPEVG